MPLKIVHTYMIFQRKNFMLSNACLNRCLDTNDRWGFEILAAVLPFPEIRSQLG